MVSTQGFHSWPSVDVSGLVIDGGNMSLPTDPLFTGRSFEEVSSQMARISPSSIEWAKYAPTNTAAACPTDAAASLPPNPKDALSPSGPQSTTSRGLPIDAKIGMIFALILVFLALVTGLLLLLRARKKRRDLQGQDHSAYWTKKELAADDIDREARGYGPHMAASTQRVEAEDTGVVRELPADSCQIFEAPGDVPTLPEPIYKSFEQDFLARFNELAG